MVKLLQTKIKFLQGHVNTIRPCMQVKKCFKRYRFKCAYTRHECTEIK